MHWKIKAGIQNTAALLPAQISHEVYYWMQRRFGGWRRPNPTKRLVAGIETWKRLLKQGYEPREKAFFEVGTGRLPVVPLAYWLMGARKTITVDLNPYLKPQLLEAAIRYIAFNREQVASLFGSLLDRGRFQHLIEEGQPFWRDHAKVLADCGIEYLAPSDASDTRLTTGSVDFHTSYTVFEHIPRETLTRIILEGNRITKRTGAFVHRIDYGDHFSYSDHSISPVNFLQYSEREWKRFAGNRYMYMNRLRHDDYNEIFTSAGHILLEVDANRDPRIRPQVESGKLKLHPEFAVKQMSILEITGAWFTTKHDSALMRLNGRSQT